MLKGFHILRNIQGGKVGTVETPFIGCYARPDFAELDVFLGQHILLTLGTTF